MASKLYVGGLSFSTTSEGLKEHFGQCGTVESATVITDKFSGQSRGFGFVEMSTEAEAQEAIARFDGESFDGRHIKVAPANPQRPRTDRSRGREDFGGGRRKPRW